MTDNSNLLNPVTPIQAGAVLSAANPLPVQTVAGTAVIGHVITDTGSTTAVTGNVATTSAQVYPAGATAITGNATGTTGAVVGTLAGVSAKTTYIAGFVISATGGVATLGPITVAGLVGSSMVFQLFSTATGANLIVPFNPPIPASAVNTPITITTTADATASAVNVNSWGFQL